VLAVVALLPRLYLALGTGLAWRDTDTQTYYEQANAILSGEPFAVFPNGYPLLVAGLQLVAPQEWVPALNIGLNITLSTLVVLLVYRLARALGGEAAGWLGGLAAALYPNQLNYVRQLLSEVPATFLLTLALFLFVFRRPLGSGIATVAAITVRTNLALVAPLAIATDLAFKRTKQHAFRYLLGLAAGLALYGSLVATNTIATASNLGPNLLITIQSYSHQQVVFSTEDYTPQERAHPLATYLSFALEHPGTFLQQRASSLWALWSPWPSEGHPQNPRSWLERALIGLRFPLLVLSAIAVGLYRHWQAAWVLALPIVDITVVHAFFFAEPRFTYPAEPAALALAALVIATVAGSERPLASPRSKTLRLGQRRERD